jgi:hypothetical protein
MISSPILFKPYILRLAHLNLVLVASVSSHSKIHAIHDVYSKMSFDNLFYINLANAY